MREHNLTKDIISRIIPTSLQMSWKSQDFSADLSSLARPAEIYHQVTDSYYRRQVQFSRPHSPLNMHMSLAEAI
jgi:hypothetical protein